MLPLNKAMTSSYMLSLVTLSQICSGLAAILNVSFCLQPITHVHRFTTSTVSYLSNFIDLVIVAFDTAASL